MPTKYKFYTEEDGAIRRIHVDLATEIGFNESVILLQLDYLINVPSNNKFHDERYWTYDSIKNLKEKYFPFWGPTTIKKAIASLINQKLLIKGNFNKSNLDKTNWYAIDYEQAAKLESILIGYKDKKGCVQPLVGMCPTIGRNVSNHWSESDQPIPKSSTKSSTKSSSALQKENFEKNSESNAKHSEKNSEQITDTKTDAEQQITNANLLSDTKTNANIPKTDTKRHKTNAKGHKPNAKAEQSFFFLDKIQNIGHTNANTKITAEFKTELMAKLESKNFVAGQAEDPIIDKFTDQELVAFYALLSDKESNYLHSKYWTRFCNIEVDSEPPKVNRLQMRKKTGFINLSGNDYHVFLDCRNAGFNGRADIVDAYVEHEMAIWDFKKQPMDKETAIMKFQKEMYVGHPIAKHYLRMTPEQRQREREIYSK